VSLRRWVGEGEVEEMGCCGGGRAAERVKWWWWVRVYASPYVGAARTMRIS
jgi:hypothetical protein